MILKLASLSESVGTNARFFKDSKSLKMQNRRSE